MSRIRRSWSGAFVAAAAVGTLAVTLIPGPAQASPKEAKAAAGTTAGATANIEVIASKLNNPRGLSVQADGTILIAESGVGKPGCAPGTKCVGLTGSVYRVKGTQQGRVVTGLASSAVAPTNPYEPISAAGPNDVEANGSGYLVLSGFGGGTDDRAKLGADAAKLGTLQTASGWVVGDPVKHETLLDPDWILGHPANPEEASIHSNPWRFARNGRGFLVTDAGANDLVGVGFGGRTTTEAIFPDNELPAPGGAAAPSAKEKKALESLAPQAKTVAADGTVKVQAVPSGIVKGADGAFYVADMGGLRPGASRIWRIVPGHRAEVFASGLTAVTDLAADKNGNLIALTLTGGFQQQGPPLPGKLNRIDLKTKAVTEIPTDGKLAMSTGLAVGPNNEIYVTNNSVGTEGQLIKVTE
ncbi:ScyD/ScyE family protein [Streptomyces melanogenes]|uniref:ScyD/ScyE family protein n=1 Tax=Streptomyces melanogenes TaxID=67326 RepID=A0ABZ1XSU1_9ACTN|nr:ScyD/ScyE family protein [Streptomyces melanogenes]